MKSLSNIFYSTQIITIIVSLLLCGLSLNYVEPSKLIDTCQISIISTILKNSSSKHINIIMAITVVISWTVYIIEWNLQPSELRKKIPVFLYFLFTSIFVFISLTTYTLLKVFNFEKEPISEWNWFGLVGLLFSGVLLGHCISFLIMSLFLLRSKATSKRLAIPRIPRMTIVIWKFLMPTVILLIIYILVLGINMTYPLSKCWYFIAFIPTVFVSLISVFIDLEKLHSGVTIIGMVNHFSNLRDHIVNVDRAMLNCLNNKHQVQSIKNISDCRTIILPQETLVISFCENDKYSLCSQNNNNDFIKVKLILANNPAMEKDIIIPCKYFKIVQDDYDVLTSASSEVKFKCLQKILKLSLWDMSYDMSHRKLNIDEFIQVIAEGDIEVINWFFEKGININEKGKGDWTPVLMASAENKYKILQILLSKGGDPKAFNLFNATPLHFACKYNFLEIAELLISFGADLEKKDISGDTPLMLAIKYNSNITAQYLIEHGANVNIHNNKKETLLYWAEKNQLGEICKLLRNR